MIKNVVFDYGQVLIHFEPEYMASRYITDEEDLKLATPIIFDRAYWDRLDDDTITDEEVVAGFCSRLPERLHEKAKKVYDNWMYNNPEVEGMKELISYVKEKYGAKTYLLSNISKTFAKRSGDFPVLKMLDGCVFSGECKMAKPNRDIFEHLLEKFDISAGETVFIDDNENNVKMAESVGIKTFMFKMNVDELKKWLDSVLGSETIE